MHFRSFFVFGGALLLIAANAFAGPKEDVAAATAKWGEMRWTPKMRQLAKVEPCP